MPPILPSLAQKGRDTSIGTLHGMPPERLTTSAACTLAEVEGAPHITELALRVRAQIRSLEEMAFNDAATKAAALCPVSNAVRSNVEVSIETALEP